MKRQTQESIASTSKEGEPSPSKKKSRTGGILAKGKKYSSDVVNIRPSKWDKFKPATFWIGKLRSYEHAQRVADAVYFYVGEPPFHFKDAVNLYPPITCKGIVDDTPQVLTTQEMFRTYTLAIAKGVEFKPQREDFIAQVKGVLKMEGFPFLAPPEDAVEDDEGEGVPPMEDDKIAEMARKMSSNVREPAAVGSGSVSFAFAGVAGFEFQPSDPASNLRSMVQPIDSINLPKSPDRPTSQDGGLEVQPSESSSNLQSLLQSIYSIDLPTSQDEGFEFQPSESSSKLQSLLQSIYSIDLPTSQDEEIGGYKQLMDELTYLITH